MLSDTVGETVGEGMPPRTVSRSRFTQREAGSRQDGAGAASNPVGSEMTRGIHGDDGGDKSRGWSRRGEVVEARTRSGRGVILFRLTSK
jgi:hypothetical protein